MQAWGFVAATCLLLAACGDGNDSGNASYDDSVRDDLRAPTYTLEISVDSNVGRLGALQLEVMHLGDSGAFLGHGDQVECALVVDGLIAANYTGGRTAKVGIIALLGINTPGPVVRCGFRTYEHIDEDSFRVDVTDASSPGGEPTDPPPLVTVSRITRR